MPIVDMPLAKLKTYKGSSPCPKDIDRYWDKAIAEMKAVDARVELVPAASLAAYTYGREGKAKRLVDRRFGKNA